MKTTIKLTTTKALTVEPCRMSDLVCLTIIEVIANSASQPMTTIREAVYLTPDQVGALMFGLEQAAPETPAAAIIRRFESECI